MKLPRLTIDGPWFREPGGRRVLLRGLNLGGDCKVPYPDGGTNVPTDFANHREVSFVGRPFPLDEMDAHFARIKAYGFNVLRLLTTWEAVEHAGPGKYDEAYLDYFAKVAARAGDFGLYVFVDFHQDVWSRMTGGDGAPGWTFETMGLDFTAFHEAGAAHVMQYKYDPARGGRQEDRYPMMTWGENYRFPGNAIPWTLFFAGRDFAPSITVDGKNIQDFLQDCYCGAMRAIALKLKDLPNVLGFDSLNEPGSGWVGQQLSYRHVSRNPEHPYPVRPGPAWSPLDGLLVARGVTRVIPRLSFDPAKRTMSIASQEIVNATHKSIWLKGVDCPFERAGAYRLGKEREEETREDFFTHRNGRKVDHERDYMVPFFQRVAKAIRAVREDWLLFAELDAFKSFDNPHFPEGTPPRTVNAGHWYDIVTLVTKTFMYPEAINPFSGKMLNGQGEIEGHYKNNLARIKKAAESLDGGAPTLIGEFGIPFDLDGAAAYAAFAGGDHSDKPWESHIRALDFMYNAMDALLLHSAQWNYTADNRNDLAIGDQWNQEDLSVYSRDQSVEPMDPMDGTRAAKGFVRPFLRACQGELKAMRFERERGVFSVEFDADPAIKEPTEIFVPRTQFPGGYAIDAPDGVTTKVDASNNLVLAAAAKPGPVKIVIRRPGVKA